MFAEKHYPENLLPDELDTYLEKGWYRMGQTIFTTHFLCFGEQFYSAIWVRLPLTQYQFRKGLRKLIQRNEFNFKVVFGKATLSREKERLYNRYRLAFPGVLASSLKEALLDGEESNIYDTREVMVYHNNQLIACSFFDIGSRSAASIIGMYDPDYHKYSLGFFTMLMEIRYCIENNIPYYYPGYVVPGYPRFDYKLRIGEVEYYDLHTDAWIPISGLMASDIPLAKMHQQLSILQKGLEATGVSSKLLHYPLFEANLFSFWRAQYFDYPILLHCYPETTGNFFLIITYDIREQAYLLLKCSLFEDIQMLLNESYLMSLDQTKYFAELLVVDQRLWQSASVEEIAAMLHKAGIQEK